MQALLGISYLFFYIYAAENCSAPSAWAVLYHRGASLSLTLRSPTLCAQK